MKLRVELKDERARRAFRRAVEAGADMRPAMLGIGELLLRSTRKRFDTHRSPDGTPWARLRDSTLKRKREGGHAHNADKILTESGELRSRLNIRPGRDYVEIGSSVIYASTHQFGAGKGAFGATSRGMPIPFGDIPARPFLGVSDEDSTEIELRIADYISGAWMGT